MKVDGRKYSTAAQHVIRRMVVQRYQEGESPTLIAKSGGVIH